MSRARITVCATLSTLVLLGLSACGASDADDSAKQAGKGSNVKQVDKGKIVTQSGGDSGAETVLVCTDANLQGLCSNLPATTENLVTSLFSANDISSGVTTSSTFNDNISYISNTADHTICFYEDTGFSGKSLRVAPGEIVNDVNPAGKGNGLNDRISSFRPC
ncbi:hypothetical protein OG226_49525 [Streptomyces sp. NBC_01261]|uniref:hypothetical protein n=1 Tax=Streptomyces sp. NBC_01261 TaxID=2903802 RepID=UPI002E327BD9|nr:hypothetical protein [Streptomyces sp. NBC_01261]